MPGLDYLHGERAAPTPVGGGAAPNRRTAVDAPVSNSRAAHMPRTDRVVVDWSTPSRGGDAQGGARPSLWWAPLNVSTTVMERLASSISPAERQSAMRFGHPRDRGRYVAARGWVRHLLAGELSCDPSEVPIVTDGRGKPRIACSDLSFSASRSADVALYAVSWGMEVGVDIEAVRTTIDIDGIMARFMAPTERLALHALPAPRRRVALFDCWTRKEAYGKALGVGLGFPLQETALWRGEGAPVTVSGWSVHQLDVAPGFAGAVAGADTGSWAPPTLRRVRLTGPDRSYRPLAGVSALPASGG